MKCLFCLRSAKFIQCIRFILKSESFKSYLLKSIESCTLTPFHTSKMTWDKFCEVSLELTNSLYNLKDFTRNYLKLYNVCIQCVKARLKT